LATSSTGAIGGYANVAPQTNRVVPAGLWRSVAGWSKAQNRWLS